MCHTVLSVLPSTPFSREFELKCIRKNNLRVWGCLASSQLSRIPERSQVFTKYFKPRARGRAHDSDRVFGAWDRVSWLSHNARTVGTQIQSFVGENVVM